MTDIVERLRQGIADRGAERLMDEAAAEIERLRERLRAVLLHVADVRAKNEQLRAEVNDHKRQHLFTLNELKKTGLEEIERLRTELRESQK